MEQATGGKPQKVVEPYSVTLNQTDLSYGQKGHNKFYIIQVLEGHSLYTEWGRVGVANPSCKLEPCASKEQAIELFKKKFRSKTANDWGQPFTPVEGKYQMVDVQSGAKRAQTAAKLENKRRQLSQEAMKFQMHCNPQVGDLMGFIWDFERMKKTMKELNFDPQNCPLGQLSKQQIQKGYKILKSLKNEITTSKRESKILDLSNQFYTHIPQSFGMNRPPPINHMMKLREKLTLLDTLADLEIANTLSVRSLQMLKTTHPYDVYLSQLNCRIHPADLATLSFLQELVTSTTSHEFSLTVTQAFTIDRPQENPSFWPFSKLPNQKLLWHGSRVTNFVGILSKGLRVAPKEAPSSGYMFGKGIYLADLSSKAAQYCRVSQGEGLLLLCQVALGNMHEVKSACAFKKPPKGYHSVKGVGRNAPTSCTQLDSVEVYSGNITEQEPSSDLKFNEYIVYDVGQVKVKYLLKCTFN